MSVLPKIFSQLRLKLSLTPSLVIRRTTKTGKQLKLQTCIHIYELLLQNDTFASKPESVRLTAAAVFVSLNFLTLISDVHCLSPRQRACSCSHWLTLKAVLTALIFALT